MKRTALILLLLATACTTQPNDLERARELISGLTLEQKASLMMHPSAAVEDAGIPAYNWWNEALHGVGRNGALANYRAKRCANEEKQDACY